MSDIVDRLWSSDSILDHEAADEIERLTQELANEIASSGQVDGDLRRMLIEKDAEIERLRALTIRDREGQIVTQGAFNAMIHQMESFAHQRDEARDKEKEWKERAESQWQSTQVRTKEVERLKGIINEIACQGGGAIVAKVISELSKEKRDASV